MLASATPAALSASRTAVARALAQRRYDIALHYNHSAEEARETVSQLAQAAAQRIPIYRLMKKLPLKGLVVE